MMGPVQMLAVGFQNPDMRGRIAIELGKLSEQGLIRVIDALAVLKDENGEVTSTQFSNLSAEEAEEIGGPIRALLGLGPSAGEGHVLSEEELVDVVGDMPPGTAAAVALLEHRWAIPLQQAIQKTGGEPISNVWLRQRDLVAAGLAGAGEA